jgi:hypothetical protein
VPRDRRPGQPRAAIFVVARSAAESDKVLALVNGADAT